MKYAKIENGLITNIVVADDSFAAEHNLINFPDYINNQAIGIGWHYDGLNFIEPDQKINNNIMLPAVTKEQLFAELQALTNKINALNNPVSLLDKVSSLLGVK